MRDSLMPSRGSGNNKPVILLLVGGTVILIIALVFMIKQRSEADADPSLKDDKKEKNEMAVPTTALVSPRPPPDVAAPEDAGTALPTESKPTKASKKRGNAMAAPGGTIDATKVNAFINTRFSQVKACYERRLKMNPLLEGKLDLNISILESGKVNAITVNRDTVRDEQMLVCVKSTIRGWVFPQPEGGRVVIGKTFNFKKKAL